MNQSNSILAKRIVELDRELSLTKNLLESSMLSEATAKQYAEEIDKQNQELAAQVEALRGAIETALHGTVFDEIGNRDDDGLIPFHETKTAISVLQNTRITAPQHLAEIRAQAGRAGFIYASQYDFNRIENDEINTMADKYAASIRRGEVK